MKRILTSLIPLLVTESAFALERPHFTADQIKEFDQRDSELFGKIVGAWVFESMGKDFQHVAQRTIYREDGTFVADYRFSSAGEVSYRRAVGFWYPLMGWFCEEENKSTDGRLIPRMVRWVNDPIDKELKIVSRTGMEAVLIRSTSPAEGFDYSLDGLSQKEFDAALASKNMLGFVAEETGSKDSKGHSFFRWILKSRLAGEEPENPNPAKK
jgi:hypothetical protein